MVWWISNRILVSRGGSHAYGLNRADSDDDIRAIALAPVSWLLGWDSQGQRGQTVKGHAGQDVVVHTVAKFCRLALNANPNSWDILFGPDDQILMQTRMGAELRAMGAKFLSKRAYQAYSGYAASQLKKMSSHNTGGGSRQEAIRAFGYDTKNAMHLIRLLLTARALFQEGYVNIRRPEREFLLSIRDGHYTKVEIQDLAAQLDRECRQFVYRSELPDLPETDAVKDWLIEWQRQWVNGDLRVLTPV